MRALPLRALTKKTDFAKFGLSINGMIFSGLISPCEACFLGMFACSDSFRRRLLGEALRLPFLKGMAPSLLAKAGCEVAKLSSNSSFIGFSK